MKIYWKNIKLFGLRFKKDLKNIELDVLPVYDDRYIKAKIRTYSH